MQLEGIHHVTAITADAQRNLDFYAGTLGLRLVKKSVNQDNTSVYHLFYADETGEPGSDITFFESPNLPIGRAGAGMSYKGCGAFSLNMEGFSPHPPEPGRGRRGSHGRGLPRGPSG